MNIKEILSGLEYTVINGDTDRDITSLTSDSRKVGEGTAFVCISGMNADGHVYAVECASKGASLIVTHRDVDISGFPADTCVVKVEDTRYAFALMSCAWFSHPSRRMKLIGVTGTKGKTTVTYMIRDMLRHAGYKCGLIGTIEIDDGLNSLPAGNTTPESYVVQESLARMKDNGCEYAVMEVSSQGLMLHRTAGCDFDIGIFTNLEPDHIGPGEHDSFEHYLSCKKLLFSQCAKGIINIDDAHYEAVIEGHTCDIETFGIENRADLWADDIKLVFENGRLGVDFALKGILQDEFFMDIPGKFSVYNALAAISACLHFGISPADIRDALGKVKVKGRIEIVDVSSDYIMMIDYAHNAMALENVLSTLREYDPGRLITLFGCGGNRSRLRRFEMGEVSGRLSDLTVITSDNPRDEEPLDIIEDIKTGMAKTSGEYIEIPDRREAIRWCIENARPKDIIVLAGKGHEDYQEIKGVKYPMDERVIIKEILDLSNI